MTFRYTLPLLLCAAMLSAGTLQAQSLEDFGVSRDLFRSQQLMPNFGRTDQGNSNAPTDYQPNDPADWGAPGAPGTDANVDLSDSVGNFPPPADPSEPPMQELFDKAGATEPILLKSPNKFITADRVRLVALYYKGSADKNTIPVILIHDKEGKKEDMQPLAEKLAAAGMAVLVPDLRGHGESTTSWVYDYSAGGQRPAIRQKDDYLIETFVEKDFQGLLQNDGLLWYQVLAFLHNAEKVNLRRLVLVGSGYGATVAATWLNNDWTAKTSPKKGHFAKNLIFLSPEADPIYEAVADLKAKPCAVTGLVFVGNLNKKRFDAAKKIRETLAKDKADTPPEESKFPLESIKTEKEGAELLEVDAFSVAPKIIEFIQKKNAEPNVPGGKWGAIK